jgi:hypothetical protein
MNLLSRLFGKSAPETKAVDPILHKDCRIFPQPVKDGGGYRVGARIEKDFGDQVKTHHLIRADTCTTLEEATETSISKARQAIDQLGASLFA